MGLHHQSPVDGSGPFLHAEDSRTLPWRGTAQRRTDVEPIAVVLDDQAKRVVKRRCED
jgi:hypothetical protein